MVPDIRTINVPALVSFREVVRLGGITAAADALGLAKSAVSRHVRQLEDQFEVRLFERGGRTLRLTPAGARLQDRVVSILTEMSLLHDLARDERQRVGGRVRIAATPEFGALVATTVFPALIEAFPDLRLLMQPSYDFEDLQDPTIDLAYRVGSFADDRLVAQALGTFRRILVAAPAFAAAHPVERPEDLATARCLLFRSDGEASRWSLSPVAAGGAPVAVAVDGPIAVRSFATLMQLAIAGHGIAFVPEFLVEPALAAGTLRRCLPGHASEPVTVFLTWRPGAQKITRLHHVIEASRRIIPGLLRPVGAG